MVSITLRGLEVIHYVPHSRLAICQDGEPAWAHDSDCMQQRRQLSSHGHVNLAFVTLQVQQDGGVGGQVDDRPSEP